MDPLTPPLFRHTPDMVTILRVLTSHVDRPDRFMKTQVGYGIAQTGEAAAPTNHPEVRDMYCSPTASQHAHSTVARREIAHSLGADTQTKASRRIVPNSILLVVRTLRSSYSLTILTGTKLGPCGGGREENDRPVFTSSWASPRAYD